MDADDKQFVVLFPKLKDHGERGLALFHGEVSKPLPSAGRQIFKKEGTIAQDDGMVKFSKGPLLPAKVFEVPLQAGRTYQFAMESKDLDSLLVLQDQTGKELAFDDDSGGNLNAFLIYTAAKDDTYKIYTASLDKAGAFRLTIVEAIDENVKERLAKRQANAAVALLKMNQPDKVWPMLKHSPDPRVRSYLIHCFGPLGADAGTIVKRFDEESDVTIRRALILSLGEFGKKESTTNDRQELMEKIQAIYRTAEDPGLHAASEWLLRHWQQDQWLNQENEGWAKDKEQRERKLEGIRHELQKANRVASTPRVHPSVKSQWYVNGQGQTMVVIPGPVEFLMGLAPGEKEWDGRFGTQHRQRISRTFAIGAKPVTVGEYRIHNKNYTFLERYAPTPDCPAVHISWYRAAEYCNWLSKEEGIHPDQWCYDANPAGKVTKLKENYLALIGYRLPTEAEMEYAIRAGAVTKRSYGDSEELLGQYAWYMQNSDDGTWPVTSKKPNDLGLFNTLGNVWCWCLPSSGVYAPRVGAEAIDDVEESGLITGALIARGGAFNFHSSFLRSASRYPQVPTTGTAYFGFRIVKTIAFE